jgi:hypothetical protein
VATYLYCIRSLGGMHADSVAGLDGAPVRPIEVATLIAWVSDLADGKVDVTVDRLKAHDAVCAAAMALGDTPLPIRFGQSFRDDAALVRAIVEREATFRERLDRVAGCVEFRVVVTRGRDPDVHEQTLAFVPRRSPDSPDASGGDGESAPEGPGTSFLRRLARAGRADLAREVACEEARHAVRAGANALIVEQQRCEATRGLAFFPVLVRRSDVGAFRDAARRISSSQQIDLSVLGPFAPYSFSGDA